MQVLVSLALGSVPYLDFQANQIFIQINTHSALRDYILKTREDSLSAPGTVTVGIKPMVTERQKSLKSRSGDTFTIIASETPQRQVFVAQKFSRKVSDPVDPFGIGLEEPSNDQILDLLKQEKQGGSRKGRTRRTTRVIRSDHQQIGSN